MSYPNLKTHDHDKISHLWICQEELCRCNKVTNQLTQNKIILYYQGGSNVVTIALKSRHFSLSRNRRQEQERKCGYEKVWSMRSTSLLVWQWIEGDTNEIQLSFGSKERRHWQWGNKDIKPTTYRELEFANHSNEIAVILSTSLQIKAQLKPWFQLHMILSRNPR